MSQSNIYSNWLRGLVASLGVAVSLASTGCQVDMHGQTLPSPYYLWDDVQYFPAGPEFKLAREAAALAAVREQERAAAAGNAPATPPPGVPASAPAGIPFGQPGPVQ